MEDLNDTATAGERAPVALRSTSQARLTRKLEDALGPSICAALTDVAVVEVMLNPDGQLFVERLGEQMTRLGTLSKSAAELIIGSVAHALRTEVSEAKPIVSGELPIGGHRFEGLLSPVVSAPTFSIRRLASRLIGLDEYVVAGVMTRSQREILGDAVLARQNIVIAGGTGSGKTTLANAVIDEIARQTPEHRLLILEDTAEIQCTARNVVCLHTAPGVDMNLLLKSTLRLRPDRIVVGEVRDGAALTLLKAWNTGHPGGVTTIHANNAPSSLRRLEQLTAEVSSQPMREVIGEAVDLVVAIERGPRGRRVHQINRVTGFRDDRYQLQAL